MPIAAWPGPSHAMTSVELRQRLDARHRQVAEADDQRPGGEHEARADPVGEQTGVRDHQHHHRHAQRHRAGEVGARPSRTRSTIGFISTEKIIDDAVCAVIASTPMASAVHAAHGSSSSPRSAAVGATRHRRRV